MKSIRAVKNPKTYIVDLTSHNRGKISPDIITVEHRNNNNKRDFLFVNKKQCKHIPCSPSDMIDMCKYLADRVTYWLEEDDKVLVIGFAETATAIGTFIAENIPQAKYLLHTTREKVEGSKNIVTFEEEHSHATTQMLLTYDDKEFSFKDFTYVLFVDDEISTGKTIINFVNALKQEYKNSIQNARFGVASICNWQNSENREKFKELDIDHFELLSGTLKDENIKMLDESSNIEINSVSELTETEHVLFYDLSDNNNLFYQERLGYEIDRNKNKEYIAKIMKDINYICKYTESIRVIGTEEFMDVPIKIGAELEKQGKSVICHSLTRSPIDVMVSSFDGESSGIKNGVNITSTYRENERVYLYNTQEKVDLTLIISDTPKIESFLNTAKHLSAELHSSSNEIVAIKL